MLDVWFISSSGVVKGNRPPHHLSLQPHILQEAIRIHMNPQVTTGLAVLNSTWPALRPCHHTPSFQTCLWFFGVSIEIILKYYWKYDAYLVYSLCYAIYIRSFEDLFVFNGNRAGTNEAMNPRCWVAPIIGPFFLNVREKWSRCNFFCSLTQTCWWHIRRCEVDYHWLLIFVTLILGIKFSRNLSPPPPPPPPPPQKKKKKSSGKISLHMGSSVMCGHGNKAVGD